MYFSPQNDGPDAFAIVEVPIGGADALGALALAGRTAGITLTARRIFTPEELDKLAAKSKGVPVPGKVEHIRSDDISPEGLLFIKEEDSPNGKPVLVVSHEISSTTTIFEISKD